MPNLRSKEHCCHSDNNSASIAAARSSNMAVFADPLLRLMRSNSFPISASSSSSVLIRDEGCILFLLGNSGPGLAKIRSVPGINSKEGRDPPEQSVLNWPCGALAPSTPGRHYEHQPRAFRSAVTIVCPIENHPPHVPLNSESGKMDARFARILPATAPVRVAPLYGRVKVRFALHHAQTLRFPLVADKSAASALHPAL
jgi:hypothetical protein